MGFKKGYRAGYEKGHEKGKKIGKTTVQLKSERVVTNPLEKMPETNPFENVINSFRELYKNPVK